MTRFPGPSAAPVRPLEPLEPHPRSTGPRRPPRKQTSTSRCSATGFGAPATSRMAGVSESHDNHHHPRALRSQDLDLYWSSTGQPLEEPTGLHARPPGGLAPRLVGTSIPAARPPRRPATTMGAAGLESQALAPASCVSPCPRRASDEGQYLAELIAVSRGRRLPAPCRRAPGLGPPQ